MYSQVNLDSLPEDELAQLFSGAESCLDSGEDFGFTMTQVESGNGAITEYLDW